MKQHVSVPPKIPLMLTVLFLSLLTSLSADHPKSPWNQYRGPNRDGIAPSREKVVPWNNDKQPEPVWRVPLGDGFSGIVIFGDQLITAFAGENNEVIAGFDRATGREKWRSNIGDLFKEEFGDGPRSTPVVNENRVYIYNSWGHLYCLDANTGKHIWNVKISDDFGIKLPQRGFATTPIVVGQTLIINAGGREGAAFIGFDKNTGEIKWKTGNGLPGYSSPILAEIGGTRQIVFSAPMVIKDGDEVKAQSQVISLSPDGRILWSHETMPAVVAMPVFVPPDKIFISSSEERYGSQLFKISLEKNSFKAVEYWTTRMLRNHFNSSVYYKGFLYGFSNATLECIDAETSERTWRKRGFGKGSLIIADNKLLIISDRGRLIIAEAASEDYIELAAADAFDGISWSSPTYADGRIYIRNREEMVCYDLTK